MSWVLQYPMHTQFRMSTNSLTWNNLLSWLNSAGRRALSLTKTETTKKETSYGLLVVKVEQNVVSIFWKLFWGFRFFKSVHFRFCFENTRRQDAVTSTDFKLSATVVLENGERAWSKWGQVSRLRRLFGFPKGRITNETIFPIGIARPSTMCGRFLW